MNSLREVLAHFALEGEVAAISPLGMGHINDTYLVGMQRAAPGYVLQRINHAVFRDVEALQRNMLRVTQHLRAKLLERGEAEVERRVLTLVRTVEGNLYHRAPDGSCWRLTLHIARSKSVDSMSPQLAYLAGQAFGDFQQLLADLPDPPLAEVIPDFHNVEVRLHTFRQAVRDDVAGRLCRRPGMVDEVERRAAEMCRAEQLHREGKLPKRINHCDTKVNNLLFDEQDRVLCIVDLDTVMPAFVTSDFGDFMRTGANHGREDDEDLSRVFFRMDIYEAYARGYLQMAKKFLTSQEVELLPLGAKMLTYMHVVRFFTDYLHGDTYYKVRHPEHNLQRAEAQLKLLQSMEEHYGRMCQLITEL